MTATRKFRRLKFSRTFFQTALTQSNDRADSVSVFTAFLVQTVNHIFY